MEHSAAIVAVIGLVITIVLYSLKVPGSILIGIVLTTIIGIPFGVTKIPEGWKPFSLPAKPHLFAFDFKGMLIDPSTGNFSALVLGKFFVIFFTFFFTDMFDTIGTLLGVAEQANLKDKNGEIQNVKGALFSDAAGTVVGACLGTSTVTSFVESSSGVAAGARTGLASVAPGILFFGRGGGESHARVGKTPPRKNAACKSKPRVRNLTATNSSRLASGTTWPLFAKAQSCRSTLTVSSILRWICPERLST